MISVYPVITLGLIYLGLYYVSIRKVIKNKTFVKKKKYILISIVLLIPVVGVFVPLFMFAEEDNDYRNDYIATDSDKTEFFNEVTSNSDDKIDIE